MLYMRQVVAVKKKEIARIPGGSGPAVKLEEYFIASGDECLFRIDVNGMADKWGVPGGYLVYRADAGEQAPVS